MLKDRALMQTALLRDFELYKPVIAAVNGFALTGGMEIIQAMDLRLSVPNAEFGLSEVMRGIVLTHGSLDTLATLVTKTPSLRRSYPALSRADGCIHCADFTLVCPVCMRS